MSTTTQTYGLTQWTESDFVNVSEINGNFSTLETAVSALSTSVAGKARVAYGSYTGTDTYGSTNSNSLILPFQPKLLVVASSEGNGALGIAVYGVSQAQTYFTNLMDSPQKYCTFTWNGTTVTWYSEASKLYQLNWSGRVYYYVAIG